MCYTPTYIICILSPKYIKHWTNIKKNKALKWFNDAVCDIWAKNTTFQNMLYV